MIIKSVRVQNFRCVKDETLYCKNLTVLVGANGSGKSTFLRALDIFYDPNAEYTEDDFYNRNKTNNIIITVTFGNLTQEEKKIFKRYTENGELTVEKELTWPRTRGSQKYYGTSLINPDFQTFRTAKGGNLRKEYNKLRAMSEYSDLPFYTNKDEAEIALKNWEQQHPEGCIRKRDGGQFFGFKEVGEARLERFTRFILVPAVRDASQDALERRGSVITEIMDLVVRKTLAQRKELIKFRNRVNKRYSRIFDPKKIPELQSLEKTLTRLLKTYVPDASVKLDWKKDIELEIPMPEANVSLVEDEYASSVSHAGHGTQRAFILAMLQYLAFAEKTAEQETVSSGERMPTELPNLILGIEEPELYQHPDRQRYLSRALTKLTQKGIPGVTKQVQVIYSTHSPLFVNVEYFDNIRVFRKVKVDENLPKQTKIYYTTLDKVAETLEKLTNQPKGSYSGETLRPRLRALMSPWVNEGFFAKFIVLVEGIKDRAAILGAARAMEHDLESRGVAVIPCRGKPNLDKAIAIFRSLNIPLYAIWDSDYPQNNAIEVNRRLLRIFNQPEEDWPEKVSDKFVCFKENLMKTLATELRSTLNEALKQYCQKCGIDKVEYAHEDPAAFEYVFKEAKEKGNSSPTMEKIINEIISNIPVSA
ncbi:MAG: ATP-dependent nuclease [Candidatus Baldrarchaeia archaeon]